MHSTYLFHLKTALPKTSYSLIHTPNTEKTLWFIWSGNVDSWEKEEEVSAEENNRGYFSANDRKDNNSISHWTEIMSPPSCGYPWSTWYLHSFRFALLLSCRLFYLPLPQPSSPAASPVNLPTAKLLLLDQLLCSVCFKHCGESLLKIC